MRWKWLLVLSLISISLVIVSGDDETEKVDTVNNDYDDESYDEKSDDTKVVEETQTDTETTDDDVDPKVETEAAIEQAEEEEPTNEDTVDVENVAVGKQKGKYMNYDDYFVASALDGSDSGYNWNGEWFNPWIDWHTIIPIIITLTCHKKAPKYSWKYFLVTNTFELVAYLISSTKKLKSIKWHHRKVFMKLVLGFLRLKLKIVSLAKKRTNERLEEWMSEWVVRLIEFTFFLSTRNPVRELKAFAWWLTATNVL